MLTGIHYHMCTATILWRTIRTCLGDENKDAKHTVLHLHHAIFNTSCGAGGKSVMTGTSLPNPTVSYLGHRQQVSSKQQLGGVHVSPGKSLPFQWVVIFPGYGLTSSLQAILL